MRRNNFLQSQKFSRTYIRKIYHTQQIAYLNILDESYPDLHYFMKEYQKATKFLRCGFACNNYFSRPRCIYEHSQSRYKKEMKILMHY